MAAEERPALAAAAAVGAVARTLARKIFEEIRTAHRGVPTDEHLLALHELFPGTWAKALEIHDATQVTLFLGDPSGRSFFRVEGSAGLHYLCLPDYCSCPAFFNSCLLRDDTVYCKHQLATLLAEATGRMERVRVSDKDLGELLRGFRLQTQTHSQADRGAAGRPS